MPPASPQPSARTDWSSLTVGQMWDMIRVPAPEHADWDQALAWEHISDLVDYHSDRVQTYRAKLAENWPPRPGSASAVFMQKVDELVASMAQLRDAAATNWRAMIQITTSITEARQRLAPVYERWAANEQTLASYAGQRPVATQPGLPTPMPSPGVSPVPAGEQDRLHAQAASIMTSLGTSTIESNSAFQTPPPYSPPGPDSDVERPWSPLGATGGSPPSTGSAEAMGSMGGAGSAPHSVGGASHGPVLAGSALTSAAPPVGTPVGSGRSGQSAARRSAGPAFFPTGVLPSSSAPTGSGWGTSAARSSEMPARRGLPVGGVLGGPPDAAVAKPVARATERVPAAHKVNAVGGVLGGAEQGEPVGGMPYGIGGGAGSRAGSKRRMRFDPDTVWEVAEGVPSVLEPGPEVTVHDPGPFIGPR